MIRQVLFTIFLFILFTKQIFAQATSATEITLSADQETISVGDNVTINIELKNANSGGLNMSNIEIKGTELFIPTSTSTSTQIRMINGSTAAISTQSKTMQATKEGDFNIGPAQIQIQNENGDIQTIESNAINLKVTPKSFFNDKTKESLQITSNSNKPNSTFPKLALSTAALVPVGLFAYQKFNSTNKAKTISKSNISSEPNIKFPDIENPNFFLQSKQLVYNFLQTNYQIEAEPMTTAQINQQLSQNHIPNSNNIMTLITACDAAQFAKTIHDKTKILYLLEQILI